MGTITAGPVALAGSKLIPNMLDLQPGPWGEAGTGTGAGCLCSGNAWKQGNSCPADPQLGHFWAGHLPGTAPPGEFYQGKPGVTLASSWGERGRLLGGWRGLLWRASVIGHLTSHLPVPQLPSEFKERPAALRRPFLCLARLGGGGRVQERAGITVAPEDLTAKVGR